MQNDLVETREELLALVHKPTPKVEVHYNCAFCKNIHSDKCPDAPDPDSCSLYDENKNISYGTKIVMLVENESPVFFRDQYRQSKIWINDNGIKKTFKLDSKDFEDYIRDKFFRTIGRAPSSDGVKDGIKSLEALTRNAKTINVRNRVTILKGKNGEDEIWIDLCGKYWRSIKITSNNHEIVEKTPPIFRRFGTMEVLCLPKKDDRDAKVDTIQEFRPPLTPTISKKDKEGGYPNSYNSSSFASLPSFKYLWRIFDYLRVSDEDKKLILTAIVSYFFVDYPLIVLAIYGQSGRGKSTGAKVIKKLLDPSTTIILDMSKNRDQFLQDLDHNFFCAYDNVSYISKEHSDILCRTSTGYGITKRKHYTNDADFVRILKRAICINGIPVTINREDLLKRALLIEALPLLGEERTEQDIYAEFEAIKPYILHDIYTLISLVLAKLPNIKPQKLFRMADYSKIGCCIAEILGYEQEWFLDAYQRKLDTQIKEVIWNNTIGNVLYDFIENLPCEEWKGTPSEFYKILKAHAKEMDISTRTKEYPKAPNKLSQEINRLAEAFGKIGVTLELIKGTKRYWHIINHNFKNPDSKELETEKLEKVRLWLLENYRDGTIAVSDLNREIEEFNLNPKQITQKLLFDGTILDVGIPTMWGVSK